MTLLIDELYSGIEFPQNFRINRRMSVSAIRPWLIKWGTIADGELVLQVLKDSEILKEVRIPAATLNADIPGTYFHGQIRFDTAPLQLNHDPTEEYTEYQLKLFMDNHTTDQNNFMGAIRRYELKFYDTYGTDVAANEAPNDMVEPLGFEIFEYNY